MSTSNRFRVLSTAKSVRLSASASAAVSLAVASAHEAHASTNQLRGVNWADTRDNFVNGVVYPSGLSATDTYTYASTSTAAGQIVKLSLVNQSGLDRLQYAWGTGNGGGGGGSYAQIRNAATGLCVDGMGRTTNGSAVGQWSDTNSDNQQWTIATNGSDVRVVNRATGLYADGMGRTASGSDLGQWSNSNSTNQQWSMVAVSTN